MQTMNVDLPDSLGEYVQKQVAEHGYSSASDYLCELVHADQLRKERKRLEAEVMRGIECKENIPLTAETWDAMRSELQARIAQRQG